MRRPLRTDSMRTDSTRTDSGAGPRTASIRGSGWAWGTSSLARDLGKDLRKGVTALVVAGCVVMLSAPAASATWSIIGVDPDTGEVGVALASCVEAGVLGEPDKVLAPIVLVPNRGAGVVQGFANIEAFTPLRDQIDQGRDPRLIIDELTSADFDETPELRQFAVVALAGRESTAAQFTGADVPGVSAQATSSGTSPAGAAQGVTLQTERVVAVSIARFDELIASDVPLEQALLEALLAGSEAGGDARCGDQTALFAHVAVAAPTDVSGEEPSFFLTVTVDEGDGQNPVALALDAYEAGEVGWVDYGLFKPTAIPRVAVIAVGVILGLLSVVLLRAGMGNTKARRSARGPS